MEKLGNRTHRRRNQHSLGAPGGQPHHMSSELATRIGPSAGLIGAPDATLWDDFSAKSVELKQEVKPTLRVCRQRWSALSCKLEHCYDHILSSLVNLRFSEDDKLCSPDHPPAAAVLRSLRTVVEVTANEKQADEKRKMLGTSGTPRRIREDYSGESLVI